MIFFIAGMSMIMLGVEHENALLPPIFLSTRNDSLIFVIIHDVRAIT